MRQNPARPLALTVLPESLAICRLPPDVALDRLPAARGFWCATRTPDELSVVLDDGDVPDGWQAERGWRLLRVEGPLPFDLTGVLAELSRPLADAGISVFAISTFDTDYFLVRDATLDRAIDALRSRSHRVTVATRSSGAHRHGRSA